MADSLLPVAYYLPSATGVRESIAQVKTFVNAEQK